MDFLHGSDWSCTTSCATAETAFLVLHNIVPECLLHSNRQLNSIPRLSGQSRLFLRKSIHSSNTFHHSSESKNRCLSYLGNVPCLGEYGNFLITNLSPRSQTELCHTDSSHPILGHIQFAFDQSLICFISKLVVLLQLSMSCVQAPQHHHQDVVLPPPAPFNFMLSKAFSTTLLRNETPSTYIPRDPRVCVRQSSTSLH